MIQIKTEDTIVNILKKISEESNNKIILDFPFWHPILHNHLSLKILQSKSQKKELIIISNDKTAEKIWKLLGIKFIKNKKWYNKQIQSKINHLKEHYTFFEYTKFEIKKFFSKFLWNIKNNKEINKIYYLKNKYNSSHKKIIPYLIVSLIVFFLILLYIYYFAINKTLVSISTEINVNTKSINFSFIENIDTITQRKQKNNQVNLNKITKKVELTKQFITSWIKQDKNNISHWKINITNLLNEEVYLLKNTEFRTKDWILFFIKNNISIPANSNKQTVLYWKIQLIDWKYSGTKSNIKKWVSLTIPWLSKNNRSKIFARTTEAFTWWTNHFTRYLKKEDLEKAKILMEENLKILAISKIKKEVETMNLNNSINIEILPVKDIFKFINLEIEIPEHLTIWDEINNFSINGKIDISTFIYNKNIVLSLLTNIINKNIISDSEKIISIDENSLRISHIIKRNDVVKTNKKFILKGTTEIKYFTRKIFDSKNTYLNTRLKNIIRWKKIEKAEKILINRPEINNVKITVKPFFLNTISNISENIEIIIIE